mmetsp:Transcript_6656/g.16964  ORF Transcript_6656/g.16964 Transcript_6656/m.16964 type:complete len:271 (+) Transcript_6656:130-942(+)|eukprot:jgi/Tetstr1/425918/TSEL_001594.t1
MYASISSSLAALTSGLQARAPRRPHGRSHGDRRPCCARASSAQTDAAEPPRRGVLLAASSAVAAALSGAPQAAVAAYGTVNSGGGTAASNESAFTTFYGAANPPATYGALGGTSPDKAKYSYVVPSTWVEEATSKVEKGAGGQDSRWVAPSSRGRIKASLLTLNRAGQQGASYELTSSALSAVAAADSALQNTLQSGIVTSSTLNQDGQEYVVYEIEAAQHYTVKATVDNTGRLFAFIVTAPQRTFEADKAIFSRMVASFTTYRSTSQFV